jgi:hypothetical protein
MLEVLRGHGLSMLACESATRLKSSKIRLGVWILNHCDGRIVRAVWLSIITYVLLLLLFSVLPDHYRTHHRDLGRAARGLPLRTTVGRADLVSSATE